MASLLAAALALQAAAGRGAAAVSQPVNPQGQRVQQTQEAQVQGTQQRQIKKPQQCKQQPKQQQQQKQQLHGKHNKKRQHQQQLEEQHGQQQLILVSNVPTTDRDLHPRASEDEVSRKRKKRRRQEELQRPESPAVPSSHPREKPSQTPMKELPCAPLQQEVHPKQSLSAGQQHQERRRRQQLHQELPQVPEQQRCLEPGPPLHQERKQQPCAQQHSQAPLCEQIQFGNGMQQSLQQQQMLHQFTSTEQHQHQHLGSEACCLFTPHQVAALQNSLNALREEAEAAPTAAAAAVVRSKAAALLLGASARRLAAVAPRLSACLSRRAAQYTQQHGLETDQKATQDLCGGCGVALIPFITCCVSTKPLSCRSDRRRVRRRIKQKLLRQQAAFTAGSLPVGLAQTQQGPTLTSSMVCICKLCGQRTETATGPLRSVSEGQQESQANRLKGANFNKQKLRRTQQRLQQRSAELRKRPDACSPCEERRCEHMRVSNCEQQKVIPSASDRCQEPLHRDENGGATEKHVVLNALEKQSRQGELIKANHPPVAPVSLVRQLAPEAEQQAAPATGGIRCTDTQQAQCTPPLGVLPTPPGDREDRAEKDGKINAIINTEENSVYAILAELDC